MLLRTSSAPVLSALNSSCFPAEPLEPPQINVHSSHFSSFQSLASPSPHPPRASHGIYAGDDTHMRFGSEQVLGRAPRPPSRLSRAQSEGDLACFSVSMAAAGYAEQGMSGCESTLHTERSKRLLGAPAPMVVSSFHLKETILEEIDEPEQLLPLPKCSSSLLYTPSFNGSDVLDLAQGFVLNDGEVYSSLKLNSSGSPIACNDKGCRPLTESECKQLGFFDMASGVGSGWNRGNDGVTMNLSNSREGYYQSLLQSDPENPLLLRNYAQHLIKKGEVKKGEEYLERAILANPNDGEVLSHYAKLQWDVNRDQDRAEGYYGQAVQAAPDDCYVMASYASFLWDVDDDEETSLAPTALPAYGATPPALPPLLASA